MQIGNDLKPIPGVTVSPRVYTDRGAFVDVVREGVPGYVARESAEVLGVRDLLLTVFGVSAGNLARHYRKAQISTAQGEAVLDIIRLFSLAVAALGDLEKAKEWMNSPIPVLGMQKPVEMCDTFEGRNIVRTTLGAIHDCSFS